VNEEAQMASLSVWRFDSPGGAAGAGMRLDELAQEGAARLVDAATIEWAQGQSKPRTTHTRSRFAEGTMGKAFWRSVFDAMLSPAGGDVPEALTGFGLDAEDLARVRTGITEGCSVLFVIAEPGNRRRMVEAFGGASRYVELVYSNLPAAEEAELRAAFTRGP
jgi:uncharacterized membrane protein